MIRKTFLTAMTAAAITLPFVSLTAKSALAEDLQFTLVNNTSHPLAQFYLSHAGTNSWEEDLLGSNVLPAGNQVTVNVADGRTTCTYDIKGVLDDGRSVEHYAVDLCDLNGGTYEFVEQ